MKGPRGGGKSRMLGALGFVKWYLQARNLIDMGGSLEQAKGVYSYFTAHIFASETITNSLPAEPTMIRTKTELGNYFKAVAASQKQVRGPHPDNLFIDEACEVKDDLILSAMPMVDSSPVPLVVMTSTFHKIFGHFQEVWDNANSLGWVRLSWDMFDVVTVFDPKIWDDEQFNSEIPDLALLKERAAGRTGDPEGWIPIANVIQAWREKPSIDYFDVEYMGSRPSSAGLVNNPEDVDACTTEDMTPYAYQTGVDTVGGLDWGFQGMTAWTPFMAHKDGVKVQLENRTFTQVRSAEIIKQIVADVLTYSIRFIHADSSHPFENADLRAAVNKALEKKDWRCTVIEVAFGSEKFGSMGTDEESGMLGNYRAYFQRRLLRIPAKYKTAIWQHKRYHYQKNSDKPAKEDDHIPDATMLALKRWPLGHKPTHLKDKGPDIHRTISGGLLDERF